MKYFVGILVLVVGAATVMKTEWLIQNFGSNDWAEEKMATFGGSRMMYKLMGTAMIFFGFMIIFDMYGGLLNATFGRLVVK